MRVNQILWERSVASSCLANGTHEASHVYESTAKQKALALMTMVADVIGINYDRRTDTAWAEVNRTSGEMTPKLRLRVEYSQTSQHRSHVSEVDQQVSGKCCLVVFCSETL
jgi:hypothetical protein